MLIAMVALIPVTYLFINRNVIHREMGRPRWVDALVATAWGIVYALLLGALLGSFGALGGVAIGLYVFFDPRERGVPDERINLRSPEASSSEPTPSSTAAPRSRASPRTPHPRTRSAGSSGTWVIPARSSWSTGNGLPHLQVRTSLSTTLPTPSPTP